jgi:hypothetical protein
MKPALYMKKFWCRCGAHLQALRDEPGGWSPCPKCGKIIRVPGELAMFAVSPRVTIVGEDIEKYEEPKGFFGCMVRLLGIKF